MPACEQTGSQLAGISFEHALCELSAPSLCEKDLKKKKKSKYVEQIELGFLLNIVLNYVSFSITADIFRKSMNRWPKE